MIGAILSMLMASASAYVTSRITNPNVEVSMANEGFEFSGFQSLDGFGSLQGIFCSQSLSLSLSSSGLYSYKGINLQLKTLCVCTSPVKIYKSVVNSLPF